MTPVNAGTGRKRWAYRFASVLAAVGVTVAALNISNLDAEPIDGTQTLVFMRHAEKPEGGLGQLTCQGLNRAIGLSTLLPARFGNADYVFAADPNRLVEEGDAGQAYSYIRPLLTLAPTAVKLGLPVNLAFGANDTTALARELLTDKYHDSVVYTAWSNGYLPELINEVAERASGSKSNVANDWPSGDFDSLYVLTLKWHNGKATMTSQAVKQGLDDGAGHCPI